MNKHTIRYMLLVAAALLIIGIPVLASCTQTATSSGTAAPAANTQVFNWKIHYYAPPQAVYDEYCVNFAKELKEMSNGRLNITPYPEGALIPANQCLDAVKNGTIEMAVLGPYYSGVMPAVLFEYGFPGTYRNYEDMVIHHTKFGFGDILAKAYDKYGVMMLGPDSPDGGYNLNSKIPITKADDFKGYKMRATGAIAEVFKELGASVVTLPGTELYTAAATGVISGSIYGGTKTSLDQMKLGETYKYIVLPFFLGAHGPNTYVVNKAKWNTLPADLQAMIKSVIRGRVGDWYPQVRYDDINTVTEYTTKKGMQVSTIPDAEFAKIAAAARTVITRLDKEKNDPDFTAANKSLENFMKWRGYW